MVVLNGRRKERRSRKYNEFHDPDDSQLLKSNINDHATPNCGLRHDLTDAFPPEHEIRRSAYENFASFLKFLGSHSTLDLMTTLKSTVSAQLDILRLYGFKGERFDDLVSRLNHHTPGIAYEDLQKVIEQEAACSQLIGGFENIFVGKETMDSLAIKKKQIMKELAKELKFTFRFQCGM